MTSPIRLSDHGGAANELERAILRADLDAMPPDGASDAVWAKLSSQLGVAGALGGLATAEAASKAVKLKLAAQGAGAGTGVSIGNLAVPSVGGWLTFVKGVVVGLLASGAIWQGQRLLMPVPPPTTHGSPVLDTSAIADVAERAPAPRILEPAPVPVPVPAPAPAPALEVETGRAPTRGPVPERLETSSRPVSAPSVAAFVDESEVVGAPGQRESQLKEEARVLRQARAQLRSGAFASALALLAASQRRFAAPELYQERESLMIELLFRSGQTAVASQRAKTFLAKFPESPHAARLRELSGP
jgi:hypothetical protein